MGGVTWGKDEGGRRSEVEVFQGGVFFREGDVFVGERGEELSKCVGAVCFVRSILLKKIRLAMKFPDEGWLGGERVTVPGQSTFSLAPPA